MKEQLKKYKKIIMSVCVVIVVVVIVSLAMIIINKNKLEEVKSHTFEIIEVIRADYITRIYAQEEVFYSGSLPGEFQYVNAKPISGTWTIDGNGDVHVKDMIIGNYTCNKENTEVICIKR